MCRYVVISPALRQCENVDSVVSMVAYHTLNLILRCMDVSKGGINKSLFYENETILKIDEVTQGICKGQHV